MSVKFDIKALINVLRTGDALRAFLRPGLESMNFSWTKNSVISRLFSAFIKAFFQSNSTNFIRMVWILPPKLQRMELINTKRSHH